MFYFRFSLVNNVLLFVSQARDDGLGCEMDDPPCSSGSLMPVTGSGSSSGSPVRPHSPYLGDFGDYICEQYSVLKLVLSYLNYYDLNTLREVNASLKLATDILLKKRTWIQWAVLNYMHGTDHRPEPVHGGHFVDLKIEPKVLFTFEGMAGSPFSRARPKICMRLRDRNDNRFFPRNDIVPKSVTTFVPIGAKGIIYTDKNEKNETVVVQTLKHKKLALLYLPTSDSFDVSVYTGAVSSDTFPQDPIRAFFCSDPRPIRGIIILRVGAPNIDGVVRFIVKTVSSNQTEPFALSGGHVSSLDYDHPPKKNVPGIIKAVIFRGDGIRCVSDFISCTTDDGVLEGLNQTSMYVNKILGKLNAHRSFIMMFQCIDRHLLPIEDHTHIAKTFPNIPIFGMLTLGEIGFRSFKMHESHFEHKKKKLDIIHVVKTTYMIVTID